MNPALAPFVVFGLVGYMIGIAVFPHVITQDTYIHNSGICVVATTPVKITTPVVDSSGNPYCKTGQLVKTLPDGS